ncbi:MAG TPA: YcaO-like family protein [Candidatus Paceibacterota bacterium]
MYRFERENPRQRFAPHRAARFSHRPGKFRLPLPLEDRLERVFAYYASLSGLRPHSVKMDKRSIPESWHVLLNYLEKEGVLASRRPTFVPAHNDRPKFFNVALEPAAALTDGRKDRYGGFGAAFSFENALSKAVGEVLERSLLSRYKRDDQVCAKQSALSSALDISTLSGFEPWQKERFPELGGDEHSQLYWVEGQMFSSGENVLLPAQLVFWNYVHTAGPGAHPAEPILARATTSGSAGHFTYHEAVLAGLLEAIQRDGFLIYWLNSLPPRVLDMSEVDNPRIRELLEYLSRYRLEATFLNTTSDIGVPSLTCVLIDRMQEDAVLSLGGGTGFSLEEMVEQSLLEALVNNALSAARPMYTLPSNYEPFTDKDMPRAERISLWRGARMLAKFDFLLSGETQDARAFIPERAPQTARAQLAYVCGELKKRGTGYEVYVYEARHRALARIGYRVVRTIVPQLVPLYFSEFAAPLGARRLREVPERLGFVAAEEFNTLPHPFP